MTEGIRVKLNIGAFPAAEYGYVYGTVTKISPDVHVDAAGGMECEVKIVKEEKKILTVVLEKLNFIHENKK